MKGLSEAQKLKKKIKEKCVKEGLNIRSKNLNEMLILLGKEVAKTKKLRKLLEVTLLTKIWYLFDCNIYSCY